MRRNEDQYNNIAGIGLTVDLLVSVFPFHIALNRDLRIVQVGDALRRHCKGLTHAATFANFFRIVQPRGISSFEAIKNKSYSLFLLELMHNQFKLKGQMAYLPEQDVLLFLGGPWVTDTQDLGSLGLTFADFPLHDATADYIFALQTQQVAISDARQLTVALREREERLQSIFKTAAEGIVVIDSSGTIEQFNPAAEQIFGYLQQNVVGQDLSLLLPSTDADLHQGYINRFVQTGEKRVIGSTRELVGRHADGRLLSLELSVSEMQLGDQVKFTGIVRDITDRKRATAALAESREREVTLGARIQQTLLLAAPPSEIEGAEVSAITLASQQIDGDYLDFIGYDTSHFDVLVGDVMGKGVPAALLAAAAKGHFQRAARRLALLLQPFKRRPEPEELVGAVHTVLTPELMHLDSFVTLCYARFDLERFQLTLVDCGHPRTLHWHRETGCCVPLEGENLPLGIRVDEIYRQQEYSFDPGDVFLFYSDGITETRNRSGVLFGEERLMDVLCGSAGLAATEIVTRIRQAVIDFAESDDLSDDLTCVAVVIAEQAPEKPLSLSVLEMFSSMDNLQRFRDFVHGIAELHLDPDALARFVLAANEAITNVVRHAYAGMSNRRLQAMGEVYPDRVRLTIYDWGMPLVAEEVAEPVFDGSAEGGWGLYIIEQCVDEVQRSRDEMGRNCLALTMRIGQ